MTIRLGLAFIPISLLLLGFALVMPDTALWRDTGEFIVSGFYLDICHPAGFPFLSSLTNLFSLIPLGPIAFRTHTACLFFCVLALILAYRLTFYFLRHVTKLDEELLGFFAILPPLLLVLTPTFLKQALTAEAYVLNTVGIELLLLLYLRSVQTGDLRYLITAAFFAGLFPGNHVTIVLAYVPMVVLLIVRIRHYARIILPALAVSLFGLAIFCYIPVRAANSPPLNTGGASTLTRTIHLVSNARDRALRAPAIQSSELEGELKKKEQGAALFLRFLKDLKIIVSETSILALVAAFAGLGITIVLRPDFGLMALWIAASHWFFFKGWQPDPWIPIFFFTSFFATILLALAAQTFADLSSKKIGYSFLALGGLALCFFASTHIIETAKAAAHSGNSAKLIRGQLLSAPANTPLLSERSYFLHTYHTKIEGFRSDLPLLYIKQITNPEYFAPFNLKLGSKQLIASSNLKPAGALENLKVFLDTVSPKSELTFEPTPGFSNFIGPLASLTKGGLGLLEYRKPGDIPDEITIEIAKKLALMNTSIKDDWQPFVWEGLHYLASAADATGGMLLSRQDPSQAVRYYEALCKGMDCNAVLRNNLASSLIKTGQPAQAARILEELSAEELTLEEDRAVRLNLALAYKLQKQGSNSEVQTLKDLRPSTD